MAGRFMKVKKIVLGVMVAAILTSQLAGCSMLNSDELMDLISEGETIEIELSIPTWSNLEVAPKTDQSWVQLDQLKTYNLGFRSDFDTAFDITTVTTNNRGSKQGCIYVTSYDGKDVHNGNSTLRDAMRNKVFNAYWDKIDVQNKLAELSGDAYIDVDASSKYAITSSINAYFNLLSGGDEDTTYDATQSLTREQFYALVFKAANGVQELNYYADSDPFAQAVGGDTDYTMYAKQVAEFGWLNADNGSLNKSNIGTAISKLEAVYMVVNMYFGDELQEITLGKNENILGYKNAGDLATTIKANAEGASSAWQNNVLAYMISNPDKGITEDMLKTLKIASQLNLLNGIDNDMLSVITKDESIRLIMNAYQAENALYGYLTTTANPELSINDFNTSGTLTPIGEADKIEDIDGAGLQDEIISKSYSSYTELSENILEIFELIYTKYESDLSQDDRLAAELIEVGGLMDGPTAILPLNGTDLYIEWRNAVHPFTQAPVDTNTPTETQTPTPVVKPANPAVPQTTTDKDTQAQQSQSSSDAKKVDTSTFTYPPNSTTEGLTAQDIAQGLYVRTDKDNKVYDQSGQYQGFRLATKDDIVEGSDELNDALYGNDDGSMLDTSGAN